MDSFTHMREISPWWDYSTLLWLTVFHKKQKSLSEVITTCGAVNFWSCVNTFICKSWNCASDMHGVTTNSVCRIQYNFFNVYIQLSYLKKTLHPPHPWEMVLETSSNPLFLNHYLVSSFWAFCLIQFLWLHALIFITHTFVYQVFGRFLNLEMGEIEISFQEVFAYLKPVEILYEYWA